MNERGKTMCVQELINELKKCNPDDIVMFDTTNTPINMREGDFDFDRSVDEVQIGNGTLKGFVFLSEELLK